MATHLIPDGDSITHRPARDCPCHPTGTRRLDVRRLRFRQVVVHHRAGNPPGGRHARPRPLVAARA